MNTFGIQKQLLCCFFLALIGWCRHKQHKTWKPVWSWLFLWFPCIRDFWFDATYKPPIPELEGHDINKRYEWPWMCHTVVNYLLFWKVSLLLFQVTCFPLMFLLPNCPFNIPHCFSIRRFVSVVFPQCGVSFSSPFCFRVPNLVDCSCFNCVFVVFCVF